jgi:hypothetical protein
VWTAALVVLIAVLFSYLVLPLFVLGQRQLRQRAPRAATLARRVQRPAGHAQSYAI